MGHISEWATAWGSLIGLADLLLGLIGFAITISGVWLAKRAAEAARSAANDARETLLRATAIADLATVMSTMEEVKRLQRVNAWDILPDRYSVLRRTLITIRSSTPSLSDEQATVIQGAISYFAAIEQSVEKALAANKTPNSATINKVVSQQMDKLTEILTKLRTMDTRD